MTEATLLHGFAHALSLQNLFYAFIGAAGGTLVGVLPGLGPASALAILLPVTAFLPPVGAITMLLAIYYGSQYGGSTTAILMNVPGEVSSVVTALDGYPLAQQGRAAAALTVAGLGSFLAGTASILLLAWIAPLLAEASLLFGAPEYFALMVVSLSALVALSGRSLVTGILAATLGLTLTTIGLDPIDGTARLAFGNVNLMSGLDVVPVLVGLFGMAEVLISMEARIGAIAAARLKSWFSFSAWREALASSGAMARGGAIGFVLGLLPGMGPGITTWIAYDVEKRLAREPERFGRGAIEGVAAPEAANNATAIAGVVPLLAFGIPTVPALAILLAALQIYGVQPGPLLFGEKAEFTWTIIAAMFIGNFMCLVLNLPLVGLWARLVNVPYGILGPIILAICLVAGYAPRNSLFDVWTVIVFGIVGYGLRKLDWPPAPMVLGLLLGPTVEKSLRQSLAMSGGDASIFFTRPLSLALLIGGAALVGSALLLRAREARRLRAATGFDAAADDWK